MKNKFFIIIIIIYTLVLSVLLVLNGKNTFSYNDSNKSKEALIDSLKTEITIIQNRLPERNKIFDSIQIVLGRMNKNLIELKSLKSKINLDLKDALQSLPSDIDSLKQIALEK